MMSKTPRMTKTEGIRLAVAYGHIACDRVEQLETELKEARAEIERKNKLIARIKGEVEASCQCCGSRKKGCRDYCLEGVVLDLIEGKSNAALEAKERGNK